MHTTRRRSHRPLHAVWAETRHPFARASHATPTDCTESSWSYDERTKMNQKSAGRERHDPHGIEPRRGRRGRKRLVMGCSHSSVWPSLIRLHGLSARESPGSTRRIRGRSQSVPGRSLTGELRGSPVGPLYFVLPRYGFPRSAIPSFALRAFSCWRASHSFRTVYAVGNSCSRAALGLLAAALICTSAARAVLRAGSAHVHAHVTGGAAHALGVLASWRSIAAASLPGAKARLQAWALVWYTIAAIILLFTHPAAGTLSCPESRRARAWWKARAHRDASRARGLAIRDCRAGCDRCCAHALPRVSEARPP